LALLRILCWNLSNEAYFTLVLFPCPCDWLSINSRVFYSLRFYFKLSGNGFNYPFQVIAERAPSVYCRYNNLTVHITQHNHNKMFQTQFQILMACIRTSSEAHPASYPMDSECTFPGVNRGRGVTLTTNLHLVPRPRMSSSNISSPSWRLHGGSGTAFLYFLSVSYTTSPFIIN
jgi:hypothetical protein